MASEAKLAASGEESGAAAMAAIQRPGGWVPDERDGFISWLRGEFAAANAMIDALCGHLQLCWPGEYDLVLACIQQRRFNWSPVLHMQHYYSVAEVVMALQQASLKMHQAQIPVIPVGKPAPISVSGSASAGAPMMTMKPPEEEIRKQMIEEAFPQSAPAENKNHNNNKVTEVSDPYLASKVSSLSIGEEPRNSFPAANASRKHLVGIQEFEGEQVNVLEGLELLENVFHSSAAAEMIELVTDTKTKIPKVSTPIQFGTIPSDILSGEAENGPEDEIVGEKIPDYIQSVVERLVNLEVVPVDRRPDSCSITLLKPGESIHLQNYRNFEQPLYMMTLGSESGLCFGRNSRKRSTAEGGEGLFCLTLPLGSVLVLQGNSLGEVQVVVSPSHSHRAIATLGRLKSSGAGRGPPRASPDSRPDSRHEHQQQQSSLSPPPGGGGRGVISPARSPVQQLSTTWPGSPARGVPSTLGTGVFLPANGASANPSYAAPGEQQMNGLLQRRPGAVPHFVPHP